MTLLIFSLQFAIVQTYVTRQAANFLSKELNADIQLNAIYFKTFSSLTLHEFSVSDPNGKRIIFSKRLHANLNLTQLIQNKMAVKDLRLTEAFVDYRTYKDSSNFAFLIDYFSSTEKKTPSKNPMQFALERLTFEDCHFLFVNETRTHHHRGIDFSDLEITSFSGVIDQIQVDSLSSKAVIHKISFVEKSGFRTQNLSTRVEIGKQFMAFDDLSLKTNLSLLQRTLRFDYNSLTDFSDFLRKVHITADLRESTIDSRDIEFFAPSLKTVNFATNIHRASLSGTVADISARNVYLSTGRATSLYGDFTIKGLPDIDRTIFNFQKIKLISSAGDVETLVPQLANRSTFELPEQLHTLGSIHFGGNLDGLYNHFDVHGTFATDIGTINTTTSIDLQSGLQYSGELVSPSLDLGKLLNVPTVKSTGIDISFSGRDTDVDSIRLAVEGTLNDLEVQDLSLSSVKISGKMEDKIIHTYGDIWDTKAQLGYDLQIDLNTDIPTFAITSDIGHLNLSALNVIKRDSVLINNTSIDAQLTGNTINNLAGYIASKNIHLNTYKGQFTISDFRFEAEGDETNRTLNLESNVMDARVDGVIDLNTIQAYFQSLAMQYAPAIGFERLPFNDQNFDLEVNIKSFAPVSTFLDPTLVLDDGAYLQANFSSDNYLGNFVFFTPTIVYRGLRLNNLAIHENADEKNFSLDIMADRLYLSDSVYIPHIAIENRLTSDSLYFTINAAPDTAENHIRLAGDIHFEHDKPAYIHFDESIIVVAGDSWAVQSDTDIRLSKGKLYFENFKLTQSQQIVEVNGILSNEADQLYIDFSRFGLASLEAVTQPLGIQLRGELNGQVEISSVLRSPQFKANITTTPMVYNDLPIGQLDFQADYNPSRELIDVHITLLDAANRGLKLEGTYNLLQTKHPLQLTGHLNRVELALFQPFLRTLVRELTGTASGDINISGSFNHPEISGHSTLHQADFTVIYLNTPYHLSEQTALVDHNVVLLNTLRIHDHQQHEATANGQLDLNQLSDPTIDITMQATNFMVLNTTYKENNLYYGTAYATGTFHFNGKTSGINIDIDATSNPNTIIHIPFNSAMTVSDSDFIYFVEADSSKRDRQDRGYFLQGLTMNMDIKITPDAEINMQTDVGSLRGTGTGEVLLKISSLGDFEMFGDYAVNSGKFHFTAQDFINKYFDIKEGGTIRWTGDPSNANINLTAIYQQRTSIGALYNAAGRSGQEDRVLAQADMIIDGTLSEPDISFDLNFPLTPYVKDELQAYLSDVNNVNQQALSLIVRRSFTASSNNEFGREVNNTLLSAGTEIAFNQLNTILSQSLNINFLDLNIRSFNDASASLRLFDDRLIFTGGISDLRNVQNTDLTFFSNRVATDAELTYRIRRDGSLMFRAYNRLNTRNMLFTPTDDYINAVGLIYRQEFETFGDFFRRMFFIRNREAQSKKTTAIE